MRKRRIIGIVILLTGLYLFLASGASEREMILDPVWVTRLASEGISSDGSDRGVFGFRLNDILGYMNDEGKPLYMERILYGSAVSDDYYINYSNVAPQLIARDRAGYIAFSIDKKGYPLIEAERCIVISTEANGLSEWDGDGNQIWERWFGSIVTSMDIQNPYIAVGFLDGTFELLDREGKTFFSYIPENSRIGAVYGCAVSPGGEQLALISGLDPQRLTILEAKENEYRVVVSRILDSKFRRAVFIDFLGSYLFYEGEGKVFRLETRKKTINAIPYKGRFYGVQYDSSRGLYYFFARNGARTTVRVLDDAGHVLINTHVSGNGFFSSGKDGMLFLGTDYDLMRFDVVEH